MKTNTLHNLTKIAAEFDITVEADGDGCSLTFANEDNGTLVRATLLDGGRSGAHRLVSPDNHNLTLALYYPQHIIDANPCMPKENVYSTGENQRYSMERAMRLACEWLTKNA